MRLLDAMILIYFARVGPLDTLLQLPDFGVTTSVQRELRPDSEARGAVDAALAAGSLSRCDVDPGSEVERTLYVAYRDGDGFHGLGDGEATSMAAAHSRGFAFVSHDRKARERAVSAGIRRLDWPDLLAELNDAGLITAEQRRDAQQQIRDLMRGW